MTTRTTRRRLRKPSAAQAQAMLKWLAERKQGRLAFTQTPNGNDVTCLHLQQNCDNRADTDFFPRPADTRSTTLPSGRSAGRGLPEQRIHNPPVLAVFPEKNDVFAVSVTSPVAKTA